MAKQLLFSMSHSSLTFNFDILYHSYCLALWSLYGLFFWVGQKLFWCLLIQTDNFSFLSIVWFLLHTVTVLSSCWSFVVPSNDFVPTQPVWLLLGLWLSWAITKISEIIGSLISGQELSFETVGYGSVIQSYEWAWLQCLLF